jgi:hypothetical protein
VAATGGGPRAGEKRKGGKLKRGGKQQRLGNGDARQLGARQRRKQGGAAVSGAADSESEELLDA